MYKYKIVLEYDGTNYSGWQTQKNAKSIQGTLITAAQKFLGAPAESTLWGKSPIWSVQKSSTSKHCASGSMIICPQASMYCW
jgi:tRNA U38,U39,U40 pseudouridine synthase TruA